LTDVEAGDRLAEWSVIWKHVDSVVQLSSGISAKAPGVLAQTIRDFAAAEAECCPSMLIEVDESDDELGFRITSEKIEMVQAIKSMFAEGEK
jgi:hypothetical protein